VAEVRLARHGDKWAVASKWEPGLQKKKAMLTGSAPPDGTVDGFATDAWLANWDVVGESHDNLLVSAGGKAVRIDVGGALRYRAQGGLKGAAWGDEVNEIASLRDKTVNWQTASVFGKMSDKQVAASIGRVLAVSDDEIASLVAKYGPMDLAERAKL